MYLSCKPTDCFVFKFSFHNSVYLFSIGKYFIEGKLPFLKWFIKVELIICYVLSFESFSKFQRKKMKSFHVENYILHHFVYSFLIFKAMRG